MIYLLGFRDLLGDANAPEVARRCCAAVEQGCGATGFVAYACWSRRDGEVFYALTEGDGEIARLVTEIATRGEAGDGAVLSEHEPDDAVAALAGEPRARALIRLAVPGPGAVCGRCNATILPHYQWCEYSVEGGTTAEAAFDGVLDTGGNERGLEDEEEDMVKAAANAEVEQV